MKPMARVTRVTLFEREVRERLSSAAVEILVGSARVLSEGRTDPGNPALPVAGESAFFGSTMLTIDLAALGSVGEGLFREPADEATAARLARHCAGDTRLLRRVRQVAEREAARLAGRRFTQASTEVRVRSQGSTVFIDVDIEGSLAPVLRMARGGGR